MSDEVVHSTEQHLGPSSNGTTTEPPSLVSASSHGTSRNFHSHRGGVVLLATLSRLSSKPARMILTISSTVDTDQVASHHGQIDPSAYKTFTTSQSTAGSSAPVNNTGTVGQEEASDLGGSELLQRDSGLLHVHSRTSLHNIQPSPTSTGLSGATASDPNASIGRPSKESRSSLVRRRNGSAASSRRSTASPKAAVGAGEATSPVPTTTSTTKPKKKRFLSFLNCCAVPDHANTMDSADAASPNKITKVHEQSRQTTASKPGTAGGSESGVALSTLSPEGHSVTTGGQLAQLPAIPASQSAVEAATPLHTEPTTESHASNFIAVPRDQPLPPLQSATGIAVESSGAQSRSTPDVIVQAPTPIISQQERTAPAQSHPAMQSRQDGEGDHQMQERIAPQQANVEPAAPVVSEEVSSVAVMPPPPPPPIPSSEDTSNPSQDIVPADAQEDRQPWLLPPIAPRFVGKKCLVLDLDETLVHSSFKVRLICPTHG